MIYKEMPRLIDHTLAMAYEERRACTNNGCRVCETKWAGGRNKKVLAVPL